MISASANPPEAARSGPFAASNALRPLSTRRAALDRSVSPWPRPCTMAAQENEMTINERMNERVSITGVGCTRFGDLLETPELAGLSLQELAAVAAREAFEDAGTSPLDVDAVFVGNVMAQSAHLPATYSHLSKWIDTQFRPGVHIDAACSPTFVDVLFVVLVFVLG